MATKEEVKKLAFEIISRNSNIDMNDTMLDESFIDYFGEDSLDIIEQCMELENTYNVTLESSDIRKCLTPANLIDIVYEKIKEKEEKSVDQK